MSYTYTKREDKVTQEKSTPSTPQRITEEEVMKFEEVTKRLEKLRKKIAKRNSHKDQKESD